MVLLGAYKEGAMEILVEIIRLERLEILIIPLDAYPAAIILLLRHKMPCPRHPYGPATSHTHVAS